MQVPMSLWSHVLALVAFVAFASGEAHSELVYQYDTPTFIENFAVRKDGRLLPARATSAVLTQLDLGDGTQETITNKSSVGSAVMGITEIVPDWFAINTMYCNLTTLSCTAGSGITWSVDLRGVADVRDARVTKLAEGPRDESLLNGMAALDERTVLMVDQALGGIWAVDAVDGGAILVITDEAMRDPQNAVSGVNGIRVRERRLYFNNQALGTFCSVPIDMSTGEKTGDVRVIADGLEPDDFEVDEARGVAYMTNGGTDELLRIDLETGRREVLVEDLAGPTSARWAEGGQGGCALYVSTTGGYAQWLSGNPTVGGAIYRVEL